MQQTYKIYAGILEEIWYIEELKTFSIQKYKSNRGVSEVVVLYFETYDSVGAALEEILGEKFFGQIYNKVFPPIRFLI